MATMNATTEAIYQRLVDNWTATPADTVYFEDRAHAPTADEWIRLSIRFTRSRQESLGRVGDRKYLRGGFIVVQTFSLRENGRKGVEDLNEAVLPVFEGVSFSSVVCHTATPRFVGPDGKWFMGLVEIDFDFSQHR